MANDEYDVARKVDVFYRLPFWSALAPSEKRSRTPFMERDIARAVQYFQRYPDTPWEKIEGPTRETLRLQVRTVARSVPGATALSDPRKIQPMDPKGPCIEPGTC